MKVLLVTAHPDDECFFFGPTVLFFKEIGEIRLLCCSSGEYVPHATRYSSQELEKRQLNIKETRRSELEASWEILTGTKGTVTVFDGFVDHPHLSWNTQALAEQIYSEARMQGITVIVTFDEAGVTGHSNHKAVAAALKECPPPEGVRLLQLHTCPAFIRYLPGVVSRVMYQRMWQTLEGRHVASLSPRQRHTVSRACRAHVSQRTWARAFVRRFSVLLSVNVLHSPEGERFLKELKDD
ncbi:N-acetylglucosaminyl phosphatidylinositol deacetylase-related [Carpediemonas membranifera]|uniref:N-acetylglucosaminylphosphatidylinositol deacetylase n=1 Tax=Carpediemonas membranifera TaxID=201153 RepID=A0A8J6B9M6_9EUKA|nr:N-acetylglucosaminyl phosphatidylinositol deacetylase-related [Carpediemonas membranifera]|eukprot:KAG9392832.1 N-acetylglucosaminyl phosphatidylinositol deacetylase-related [Carpediemonas membranifera]